MRYSRFSNRFEHLVSGHRFIRRRVSLSKEHVTRITSQSRWDSGCTPVCSISLALGVLHRCTPFSANSLHRGAGFGSRPCLSGNFGIAKVTAEACFSSRQTNLSCRNCLADNHHPGGTGPPEPRESRLVQAALPSLNWLNTMQLRKLPSGARHWHSACSLFKRKDS